MSTKETVFNWVLALAVVFSTGCLPFGGGGTLYGPPVPVGGTISGLEEGEQVELLLTQFLTPILPADTRTILEATSFSVDGKYRFTETLTGTPLTQYEVEIISNPTGKLCTIDNPTGPALLLPITDVHITCGEPQLAGLLEAVPDLNFATCINQQAYEWGDSTAEEITNIICIDRNINDASGLDFFPNLKSLYISHNNISSINLSTAPNLTSLSVGSNLLLTLDVSALPDLNSLSAANNELSTIDLSNNTALSILDVGSNNLASINLSANPELSSLYLSFNNLTTIDLSSSPALTRIRMSNNDLTALDLSSNPALINVDVSYNLLTSIDLSQVTHTLSIILNNNRLTSVDLRNLVDTNQLSVSGNFLTNIDNIPLATLQRADVEVPEEISIPVFDTNFLSFRDNPWDDETLAFFAQYAQVTPFYFRYGN